MKRFLFLAGLLLAAGAICVFGQQADPEEWDVDISPPPAPRHGFRGERPPPPPHMAQRMRGDLPEGAILEQWLKLVRERNPELHEELERLRREDPGELRRRMRERRQALQRQRPEFQRDPHEGEEIRELERAAWRLAQQAREAAPDRRPEIEAELRGLLVRQFELREARRERHMHILAERLEQLQKLAETRRQNQDAIIERRLREMTSSDWRE